MFEGDGLRRTAQLVLPYFLVAGRGSERQEKLVPSLVALLLALTESVGYRPNGGAASERSYYIHLSNPDPVDTVVAGGAVRYFPLFVGFASSKSFYYRLA